MSSVDLVRYIAPRLVASMAFLSVACGDEALDVGFEDQTFSMSDGLISAVGSLSDIREGDVLFFVSNDQLDYVEDNSGSRINHVGIAYKKPYDSTMYVAESNSFYNSYHTVQDWCNGPMACGAVRYNVIFGTTSQRAANWPLLKASIDGMDGQPYNWYGAFNDPNYTGVIDAYGCSDFVYHAFNRAGFKVTNPIRMSQMHWGYTVHDFGLRTWTSQCPYGNAQQCAELKNYTWIRKINPSQPYTWTSEAQVNAERVHYWESGAFQAPGLSCWNNLYVVRPSDVSYATGLRAPYNSSVSLVYLSNSFEERNGSTWYPPNGYWGSQPGNYRPPQLGEPICGSSAPW